MADIVESAADPRSALTGLVTFWKQLLCESDFRAGCPIVALAVDGPDESLRPPARPGDTFRRVAAALIARLASPEQRTQATSSANVAGRHSEGAVILCRVQRSTRPLDDVAAHLAPARLTPREQQMPLTRRVEGASASARRKEQRDHKPDLWPKECDLQRPRNRGHI